MDNKLEEMTVYTFHCGICGEWDHVWEEWEEGPICSCGLDMMAVKKEKGYRHIGELIFNSQNLRLEVDEVWIIGRGGVLKHRFNIIGSSKIRSTEEE